MNNKQFEEHLKLIHFRAITELLAENGLATTDEAERIRQRIREAETKLRAEAEKAA